MIFWNFLRQNFGWTDKRAVKTREKILNGRSGVWRFKLYQALWEPEKRRF